MSLIVSNKATDKQIAMLKKLGYLGKWNLTIQEAADLLEELWEEKRLEEQEMEFNHDYMGFDMWGN